METIFIELIGYLAGILTSITMLPQVIKTYKTKKVEDISLLMVVIILIGVGLWSVYGYLINSMPVLIMDTISFFLVLTELLLILKYKVKK